MKIMGVFLFLCCLLAMYAAVRSGELEHWAAACLFFTASVLMLGIFDIDNQDGADDFPEGP